MARAELIGLTECPECGNGRAEVRNDKGGNPYRFCPDCTSQYFTRGNDVKVANLLKKVRKVNAEKVVDALVAGGAVAATKLPKAAAPVPAQKTPAETTPTPPKKNTWAPLIG